MANDTINLEDYNTTEWTIMLHDRIIARFSINEGEKLIIGRGSDADVVIDNSAISRHHSTFELKDGTLLLSDLNSTNGTSVNGDKITTPVPVTPSDTIAIGKFRLTPASTSEKEISSSYATAMDMDDETIFVSSPKTSKSVPAPAGGMVDEESAHTLKIVQGEASPTELSLSGKSSIKIGKDLSCDIIIRGWFVAKAQCYIIRKDEKFFIVPQRSLSNTKLNDVIIKGKRQLRPGDTIEIRRIKIRFD